MNNCNIDLENIPWVMDNYLNGEVSRKSVKITFKDCKLLLFGFWYSNPTLFGIYGKGTNPIWKRFDTDKVWYSEEEFVADIIKRYWKYIRKNT